MEKKSIIFNKQQRFKKSSQNVGQFFCDQHLLKNQITIDELEEQKSAEEEVAEKLGEASQEVAKHKTKKKKITNVITFLINIVVVVVILLVQLLNSEVQPFGQIIASGNFRPQYILVIALSFALVILLDTHRSTIMLKQSSGRLRPALCYKMVAVGRYYDCITPMSTGGQPFQVFYLNKRGVPASTAISIPLARYVVFQLSWLAVSIAATVYSTQVFGETNLVSVASFVGFALNFLLVVGVLILSISKRVGKLVVAKTLKLLSKIKIVKNYEKVYDKVMDTVGGFQSTMKTYTKRMGTFSFSLFSNLVQSIINFSMPYFIYLMLGGVAGFDTYLYILVYSILIELASGFIPLPGGTGMSEVSFTLVFGSIFPEGTVFWGLLLWRFMNYYIYIIQGIIIIIYDYIWGNKKYEWQKKRWELEAESVKFKQEQIKKYNKRSKKGKIKL